MFIEVYCQKGERNNTNKATQIFVTVYYIGTNLLKRINLSEVNTEDFTVHKTP